MAVINDRRFLLMVDKNINPPGLNKFEQSSMSLEGSGTCSTTSRQQITSKNSSLLCIRLLASR